MKLTMVKVEKLVLKKPSYYNKWYCLADESDSDHSIEQPTQLSVKESVISDDSSTSADI